MLPLQPSPAKGVAYHLLHGWRHHVVNWSSNQRELPISALRENRELFRDVESVRRTIDACRYQPLLTRVLQVSTACSFYAMRDLDNGLFKG